MKVLCFADLHLCEHKFGDARAKIQKAVESSSPDAVAVCGDIFDVGDICQFPLLESMDFIFSVDVPVVFCLGNHEFAFKEPAAVLSSFLRQFDGNSRLHCLDVCGHFDLMGYRFVGNVLWYDGSLSTVYGQPASIPSTWLDCTIRDFDWALWNRRCIEQIDSNMAHEHNILVTHCVPHHSMNRFMSDRNNIYNMFSGMYDFLSGRNFDAALCGHTHRKAESLVGCVKCINVGNDYRRTDSILLELPDL